LICYVNVMVFLFLQDPIVEKIRTIAQKVYGADDIELSPEAQAKIDYYNQICFCTNPIRKHQSGENNLQFDVKNYRQIIKT